MFCRGRSGVRPRTLLPAPMAMAAARAAAPILVTSEWLAPRLASAKVLDATWYMPVLGKDAQAEHDGARIPGSRFFSIDAVDDSGSGFPHMLPSAERFGRVMDDLGVANEDHVVVYDSTAVGTASHRAFWTFLCV